MTQKTIKIFTNELYSTGPKQNYIINKTDLYRYDDFWSLDILDLKEYGLEYIADYGYVLVVIDNFSIFGWVLPVKNKNCLNNNKFFRKYSYIFKKNQTYKKETVEKCF